MKNKNIFFIVAIALLAVLFVFAFAQSMQVNAVRTGLQQTQAYAPASDDSPGQAAPVQSAPAPEAAMVGGC